MILDRCPHPLGERMLWSWDNNRATCKRCGQRIVKLIDNNNYVVPVYRFKAMITLTEWP